MNCNTAFDMMTDPHGAESLALEHHLAHCPRCRQMQSTLSPALGWLAQVEAVSTSDTDEFEVAPASPAAPSVSRAPVRPRREAVAAARAAAARLSAVPSLRRADLQSWAATIARSAALVALGAMATLALVAGPQFVAPPKGDCTYRRDQTANRGVPASWEDGTALVRTCAACHSDRAEEPTPPRHGAALDFQLDRLLALAQMPPPILEPLADVRGRWEPA